MPLCRCLLFCQEWWFFRKERTEKNSGILLEEVIERNIGKLFLNYDVVCAHPYRIMRNADLTIDEDDASDLVKRDSETAEKAPVGRSHPLGSGRGH